MTDQSHSTRICRIGGCNEVKKEDKGKEMGPQTRQKAKKIKLPKFEPPTSVRAAKDMIDELDRSLARSIHDHAYKYGVAFGVVKREVGHGHFLAWVETNTRWSHKTVRNYMKFAEMCLRAGLLLTLPTVWRPEGQNLKLFQLFDSIC